MNTQHQMRVRLSLPPDLHARLMALPPSTRSQAISAVLVSVCDGIDLPLVAACTEQLRRLGVLLINASTTRTRAATSTRAA